MRIKISQRDGRISSLFELHVGYRAAHEETLPPLLDTITVLDFMLMNTISKDVKIEDMFKTQ